MLSLYRRPVFLSTYRGDEPEDPTRLTPLSGLSVGTRPGPIIGMVIFTTHRGERAEAILDVEGRWRCPRLPVLDRVLNILFDPAREGMGGAPFGHVALRRVADWLKGVVEAEPTGADRSSGRTH
jgi:hypothetical protein